MTGKGRPENDSSSFEGRGLGMRIIRKRRAKAKGGIQYSIRIRAAARSKVLRVA